MTRNRRQRSEEGQALVLLALAFIILLGFVGLAIDGGIVYTERRRAQNAADAAAMAGALSILNGGEAITPGFARAFDNGYDNNQADNWVEVYNPPIDGMYAGNLNYVQVKIRARVNPVFSQVVFQGRLENRVMAIARARPSVAQPIVDGQALVGLAPHGCSVVWSHGNNMTTIDGSGIFVNSDDPDCAMVANGGNQLYVNGGDINVVGGWEIGNNSTITPLPTSGATQVRTPVIDPPTCASDGTVDSTAKTVTPGRISSLRVENGDWTFAPGVYCLDNGFTINGGSVTGTGVTFYVNTGDVTWSGNATIRLAAPTDGEWANMLVYQNPTDTDRATINGDSNSSFTGTIFIPGAEVQVNGTGGADGFHSQIVGYKVDLSGTADMKIVYQPEEQYVIREPGKVDLTE